MSNSAYIDLISSTYDRLILAIDLQDDYGNEVIVAAIKINSLMSDVINIKPFLSREGAYKAVETITLMNHLSDYLEEKHKSNSQIPQLPSGEDAV